MHVPSLDPRPAGTDDGHVNTLRSWTCGRANISTLVILALVSFGATCAMHGGAACADPPGTMGETTCPPGHDSEGDCGDRDGCDQNGHRDCSHASVCCSTWFPPTAAASLPTPSMASAPLIPSVVSLASAGELVSRPA